MNTEMAMEQINKMAFALAELQTHSEIYAGLFLRKEDAEVIFLPYRELGASLKKSLSISIIIGCAGLFTDPEQTYGDENMSFNNLYKKHSDKLSQEAKDIKESIEQLVQEMSLKRFRNKYVGHFGLDENLGKKSVTANITTENLKELMKRGQILLNLIIRDAQLLQAGHSLGYYTQIPENRSPKRFLDHLRRA